MQIRPQALGTLPIVINIQIRDLGRIFLIKTSFELNQPHSDSHRRQKARGFVRGFSPQLPESVAMAPTGEGAGHAPAGKGRRNLRHRGFPKVTSFPNGRSLTHPKLCRPCVETAAATSSVVGQVKLHDAQGKLSAVICISAQLPGSDWQIQTQIFSLSQSDL